MSFLQGDIGSVLEDLYLLSIIVISGLCLILAVNAYLIGRHSTAVFAIVMGAVFSILFQAGRMAIRSVE